MNAFRAVRFVAALALATAAVLTVGGGDGSGRVCPLRRSRRAGQYRLLQRRSTGHDRIRSTPARSLRRAVSTASAPPGYTPPRGRASLFVFQPRKGVDPSDWSGQADDGALGVHQRKPSDDRSDLDRSCARRLRQRVPTGLGRVGPVPALVHRRQLPAAPAALPGRSAAGERQSMDAAQRTDRVVQFRKSDIGREGRLAEVAVPLASRRQHVDTAVARRCVAHQRRLGQ